MKVVYDDQLNADLARILSEGKDFITIISPYIKLSSRIKDILKQTAKNNPKIKLIVVFGKNESSPNKSLQRSDLDFFINEFKDVAIFYKDRLHAKCYVNEKMGMITSMNLYEYSLEHNLELGVFFENNGIMNDLNKAYDYISNQKATTLEGQVYYYMNHVKETSLCIYEKTAVFKEKYFGLTNEYSNSEIKVDILSTFFKKYVYNRQTKLQNEVSIKKESIKAPTKPLSKTPTKTKATTKTTVKTLKEKADTKVLTKAPKSKTVKITAKSKPSSKK